MGINLGSSGLSAILRGSGSIQKVYKGSEEIFLSGPVAGEVLATPLIDGTAITSTETTNGTVTYATSPTQPGPSGNALTLTNTANGNCWAGIDLGQTYDELYIQFYVCVLDDGGDSGGVDLFEIGAAQFASDVVRLQSRLDLGETRYRPQVQSSGGARISGNYMRVGTWFKFGLRVNTLTGTADYYVNDNLFNSHTVTGSMRYITFGGNRNLGFKQQVYGLTVNELGFQNTYSIEGIDNIWAAEYIDYSMDASIDASGFTGQIKEPYDPAGGTAYIDGPLRYFRDSDANYFSAPTNSLNTNVENKVFFKRGATHYVEDLLSPHTYDLGTNKTTATKNITFENYGVGNAAIISGGVPIPATDNAWVVHDAPNNIWKVTDAQFVNVPANRFTGAWQDNLGLSIEPDIASLLDYEGTCYMDGATNTLYVRCWNLIDPNTVDFVVSQDIGFKGDEYSYVKDLHFKHTGCSTSEFGTIDNCEATDGANFGCLEFGVVKNCYIHDQDGGNFYYDRLAGRGAGSGSNIAINAGDDCAIFNNIIEGSYQGVQLTYDGENSMVAFNTFKNIKVNVIGVAGGVGGTNTSFTRANRIINNTILHCPPTVSGVPYPTNTASIGHGLVWQSIVSGTSRYESANNLIITHQNQDPPLLSSPGGANCVSSAVNAGNFGYMDHNIYHVTSTSTSKGYLFTSGQTDANDLSEWQTIRSGQGWTAFDGVSLPDSNTIANNGTGTFPIAGSEPLATEGVWPDVVDVTPAAPAVDSGYVYDFSAWPDIEAEMGALATGVTRNIGSK